ncbi:MAG: exodeoxyribonuclease VII small subunit [Bacteroidia bacterium]|nr:MAG: exodeoxyribonuclease VII small subunit [Bacteroidia bacterium]
MTKQRTKKISYTAAIDEIQEILNQIESGDLEIDELAEKVKRVSTLIKTCKDTLFKTEKEVEKILKEIEFDE